LIIAIFGPCPITSGTKLSTTSEENFWKSKELPGKEQDQCQQVTKPPRSLVSLDIEEKRTMISLQTLPDVCKNHPEARDALRKNYSAPAPV